jgi:hypothetical protein
MLLPNAEKTLSERAASIFLTSWETIIFSRGTVLCGISYPRGMDVMMARYWHRKDMEK